MLLWKKCWVIVLRLYQYLKKKFNVYTHKYNKYYFNFLIWREKFYGHINLDVYRIWWYDDLRDATPVTSINKWRSHLQSDLNAKCWFWEKWEKSVLWKKSKIFKICLGESEGSTFTHLIIFSFLKNMNAVSLQCVTKKILHLDLFRHEKHVSKFFLMKFSKIIELF